MAAEDAKTIQIRVQAYISELRYKRNLRAQTIIVNLSAIIHFYQYNDVIGVNWKKLKAFCGERKRAVKDRAYTIDEIRKLLDHADDRKRIMILLMASAGLRIGSIADLKIRNLERISGLYKIMLYEGADEEYFTFCTPECVAVIDLYLEKRKRAGEDLTPDAPLIREEFSRSDARNPRHVSTTTLNTLMKGLLVTAGIRETKGYSSRKRHDVMANHGLRKFFNTQLIKAGVNHTVKEHLMGHKTGLDISYARLTDEEITREYLKAADLLTIESESKLRSEIRDLEKKLSAEAKLREKIMSEIDAKNKPLLDQMAEIQERLNKFPKLRLD
ncbi:MAG: site-specific integrase [Nitrososphaera sp.]